MNDEYNQYDPFDVLITDIEKNDLHGEISNTMQKKYLSPLL
jgi:hypothetical protein